MKKLFGFIIIVIAGFWLYGRCTDDKQTTKDDVLKQVTVSAKVANLRTGPGTNHAIISVNADGSGGNLQIRRGTKLDVLSESGGWFQVRIPGEERTAYIKASLCNDPTAKAASGKGSGRKGKRQEASSGEPSGTATESSPEAAPATPLPDDDVVEEITTGQAKDEVIF